MLITSIYLMISIILIVYNHMYIHRKGSNEGKGKEAIAEHKHPLTRSNVVIILSNIDNGEAMNIVNHIRRFIKEISGENETLDLED